MDAGAAGGAALTAPLDASVGASALCDAEREPSAHAVASPATASAAIPPMTAMRRVLERPSAGIAAREASKCVAAEGIGPGISEPRG